MRHIKILLSFCCALLLEQMAVTGAAYADDYPTRPIRILVGFPAGSGADIVARYFAGKMQDVANQTVVVENKPGANGNIAIGLAARAKPDGYTILFSSNSTIVAGKLLYKDLGFDPQADITPAGLFSETTFALVVPANSPDTSVGDLTHRLKGADRAKYGFANQVSQVAAEYYKSLAGVAAVPVSYRSGPDAIGDLTSGALDFVFIDGTFGSGQVRAGKVKVLAVTTTKRHPIFGGTPTMQELGWKDFDFSAWWGAYLPAGTSSDIVERIGGWMNKISATEETRIFLERVAGRPLVSDVKGAQARIAAETVRWTTAVKAAGITPQ
ncbi:tripartite tricarboxylate transporter substrate binding protein [Roseiarcaceae bacterium H3SJ34-1]|uniref:Bug family tripartite tricarboxylate transporter substrate binding protein n=1 Tax=Terripilifer ovatus TaxID=3032367 RepID=UPI003AB9336E|nr:tripartite tricarboxylate transporter substrate binding protein [Roseiarcaceae bacterium H3SJ34-1]